jgi:hypothetical protein
MHCTPNFIGESEFQYNTGNQAGKGQGYVEYQAKRKEQLEFVAFLLR